MEMKLTKESICINEIVYDGTLEQSIELDYLLPDYCPGIFKVLKCRVTPKITSERIANGKLMIDGLAMIRIIYVGEEGYRIRSLTQKQVFSKVMELKEGCDSGTANATVKCDYVNCRVINQRRLDIRGAVSVKVTVSATRQLEVLSQVSGCGVQVNHQQVTALDQKLISSKEFTIKEELELAYGKPAIAEILDSSATAALTDYKLIANKVILKGEIQLHLLYCAQDAAAGPEIMDFTVPISQIVELAGVTEDYQCVVGFDVTGTEFALKQNGDGECKCFDAEFCVRACCEADKNADTSLIGDIFSTGYELQASCSKVKIEQLVCVVNENCVCKSCVPIPQGEIGCVYDISCDFTNESCRTEDGQITVLGNLNTCILALDSENMPTMIEKGAPVELKLDVKCAGENALFHPYITVASVSYNLLSGNEIEVRADIRVCGNLYQYCYYTMVNTVSIDPERKKQRKDDAVLRLYYAQTGERVWDIAKRFDTSMEAVMLENNLEAEALTETGMLLIPILD